MESINQQNIKQYSNRHVKGQLPVYSNLFQSLLHFKSIFIYSINMQTINTSAENFKSSPLGFLMAVLAKYQAYNQKHYDNTKDQTSFKTSKDVENVLDNLKIELSKIESLKKESSNEAVLVHVIENCDKYDKNLILESVFEYLNLLDTTLQAIDKSSDDGKSLVEEYYNVSRLGLILNCYLGEFENDDFFYGTFGEMAEAVKASDENNSELCNLIISKIEKADINMSFRKFVSLLFDQLSSEQKNTVYENIIQTFSDSLLNKVLNQEVTEEELNKLACAKQIQRIYGKLMIK